MITVEQFWQMADEAKLETEYSSDKKLQFLQTATFSELQAICIQYRYFTAKFPDNLGILISKLPYGNLKTLIAEILSEELGEGNSDKTHLRLYDDFLVSIGIDKEEFASAVHPANVELLKEIQELNKEKSHAFSVGLCGMGGECLCQIYLSNMYKNFIQNPHIQDKKDSINWNFWTFHVGEADILHRQLVRQAITEIIDEDATLVNDLAAGYVKAKENWDKFWTNNYNAVAKTLTSTVN